MTKILIFFLTKWNRRCWNKHHFYVG